MKVHVVDPAAYTPPYDHALCAGLAAAGAEVDLYTSRFAYGPVPEPAGYARHEASSGPSAGCTTASTPSSSIRPTAGAGWSTTSASTRPGST
ncbi:MAG: hypothetical protein LC720_09005 [Actinobacteria bacterium]|nr:hypothetical protein [Actinomycetota bacterium]